MSKKKSEALPTLDQLKRGAVDRDWADRVTREQNRIPFEGLDYTGGIIERGDHGAETRAWRSLSRAGASRREKRLAEFDKRVADLSAQMDAAVQTTSGLTEQLRTAPTRDSQRLAEWTHGGRNGSRPELEAKALPDRIREAEAERDGLQRAIDDVLTAKAAWVEKNRDKLVRDSAAVTSDAAATYTRAVEELERTRADLINARLDEIWTLVFPSEAASRHPLYLTALARGLAQRMERAGAGSAMIDAATIGRLLREDAQALATAIAPEHVAVIQGRDPGERDAGGALWDAGPVGQDSKARAMREAAERERQEMAHASARYRAELGID